MKKMLFCAAMSAIVLIGCTKSESIDTPKGTPISFYSYVGKIRPTKGTPLSSFTENTTGGLVAYADITTDYNTPDPKVNNVKLVSTGVGFEPVTLVEWPATGKLNFFAYAPYEDKTNLNFVAGNGTTPPSLTYTVPTAVASQVDVMVAEPQKEKDATSNSGSVALPFHHALTQVKFSAKTAADYSITSPTATFKVKSVTVKSALSSGAITLNLAIAPVKPVWTNLATAADFAIGLKDGAAVDVDNKGALTALCAANGMLMMLPQTLSNDIKVELVFDKTIGTANAVEVKKIFTLNKAIVNQTPITEWEPNKIINYVFSLSASEISFTGTITGWDTVGGEIEADIK